MTDKLGERVKSMREKLKMTQEEVAQKTNISRSNIGKIENNQIVPNCNAILSLSKLFGVTTDWLITGVNPSTTAVNQSVFFNDIGNISNAESDIILKYRELKPWSKEDVQDYINMKYEKDTKEQTRGLSTSNNGDNGEGEEAATSEAI